MASKRMLLDSVTIFNYLGEDDDGNALYQPTIIQNVYVRMAQGISLGRTESGVSLQPQDELIAYIFDKGSKAENSIIPFSEWDALADKSGYWTIHDDGKDLMVIGLPTPTEEGAPPDGVQVFKASRAIRRKAGRPRLWHWEVHCA